MNTISTIITELKSTTKRTEKEAILAKYGNNTLFKDILHFTFNPYIVTGIAKKKFEKIEKKEQSLPASEIKTVPELFDYLKANNTGRDVDIIKVLSFIRTQPVESQGILKCVVIKDLILGMDAKTINKVYDKLIPIYDVLLGEKYKDYKAYLIGKIVIITLKLDGNRCTLFKDDDVITLRSRSGQPMVGFIEIEEEAKNLPNGYAFDGEIRLPKPDGMDSRTCFQLTQKVTRKDGIKKGLYFHVFDRIPIDEFNNNSFTESCTFRKEEVKRIITASGKFNLIKEVPILYYGTFDESICDKIYEETQEMLEEGIMINVADAVYNLNRTKNILKRKPEELVDLRVVGWYEGKKGKNIGRFGGFIVEWKSNTVNVGGGYSDKKRIEFFENPDSYIGRIIEVLYTEESQDDNGKPSLRYPRFKRFRDDKTEESYS